MPEIPEVIPGEFIFDTWGNPVARRSTQRYQDSAQLATLNPTPETGDLAYVLDVGQIQIFDGNNWVMGGGGVSTGHLVVNPPLSATKATISLQSAGQSVVELTDAAGSTLNRWAIVRTESDGLLELFSNAFGDTVVVFGREGAGQVTIWSGLFNIKDPLTTGDAANVTMTEFGAEGRNLFRKSTSARKYKTNIQPADELADLTLEPVTFHRDDDDKDFIGFIADDLAAQDSRIGEYSPDGEIENYDLRAVVAILAAKVNDLTARIEALES